MCAMLSCLSQTLACALPSNAKSTRQICPASESAARTALGESAQQPFNASVALGKVKINSSFTGAPGVHPRRSRRCRTKGSNWKSIAQCVPTRHFSSACQIRCVIPTSFPHAWLIEAGTNDVAAEPLFDGFCGRLAAAGVPIARGFVSVAGLHPLRRAYSLTWHDGRIVEATDFGHATMATAMWQTSPFRHMLETKTRRLHRRLVGEASSRSAMPPCRARVKKRSHAFEAALIR